MPMLEAGEKVLNYFGRGSTPALALLFAGGIAAGVASQFGDKRSYTRRNTLPSIMENVTGDPQFAGRVAREEWNDHIWKPNGSPTQVNRRAGFNPSGNIVLGLYNTRNG